MGLPVSAGAGQQDDSIPPPPTTGDRIATLDEAVDTAYRGDPFVVYEDRLRAALETSWQGGEQAEAEATLQLSVSYLLLRGLRNSGRSAEALKERVRTKAHLAQLDEYYRPEEHEYLVHLTLSEFALLDLDLGRLELAARELGQAKQDYPSFADDPMSSHPTNLLYLSAGRHDRVESPQDCEDPDLKRNLDRHGLIGELLAGQRAALAGELPTKQQRDDLYARVAEHSSSSPARFRIRLASYALSHAMACGDLEQGQAHLAVMEDAVEGVEPDLVTRTFLSMGRLEVGLRSESDSAELEDDLELAWASLNELAGALAQPEGGVGLFSDSKRRDLLDLILRSTRRVEGDEAALGRLLQARDMGTGKRTTPPETKQLVSWLGDLGAGSLEWFAAESGTLVAVLDGTGLRWIELDPVHTIQDDIEDLRRALSKGQDAREPARRVAATLLPKSLADQVSGWEHAFLAGNDLLGEPDLEALPLGESGPLGLVCAVSYVPSVAWAHAAGRLRDRPSRSPPTALTLLATDLEFSSPSVGRVEAIPGGEDLEAVFEIPWAKARVLSAKLARLEAIQSPAPDLWTLFGHGVLDPSRVSPTGLLLADANGAPAIADWTALNSIPAPLVCSLLACGASRGVTRYGDGGASRLPGALLSGGSRAVLASRRDLNAASAMELHRAWLEQLSTGSSVALALRDAKRIRAEATGEPEQLASLLSVFGLGSVTLVDLESR